MGKWRWGEGVLFCSLLIEDRLSNLKEEEEETEAPSQCGNTGAVASRTALGLFRQSQREPGQR